MRYAVVTFGCRVNQGDSLRLAERFGAEGAVPSAAETADVVVVNTCSVTAAADQAARQAIRRIARTNPSARVVVTGCYASRRPDEVGRLPGVLRVVGNDRKEQLLADAASELALSSADRYAGGDGACGAPLPPAESGRTAYTLGVQTGCDEVCAYCIIPSTRGPGRSAPPAEVVGRIARAVRVGFKEVVITGVHLGSYGRDLQPRSSLLELLRLLDRLPDRVRYRLSSLEPADCTPAIVDLVAASGRFAPHFHLPLQHASDRILRAMSRPYRLRNYRRLVDHVRRCLPDASIGADVIVGFPGETEDDLALTLRYLAESPLTYLHVFPYSDRPGTSASALGGKVSAPAIRQRARAVRDVGTELTRRFHRAQVGTVRRALTLEGGAFALTDNYLKVRVARRARGNEWVRVRITRAAGAPEGTVVAVEGRDAGLPA